MADRGSKHGSHSRTTMIHRRRRTVGSTAAISVFLTLGLGPLVNPPKAAADGFDAVIDQVVNAITGSLGDVAAGSAAVPELGSLGLGAAESTAAAGPVDAWLHALEQDWTSGGFGQHV